MEYFKVSIKGSVAEYEEVSQDGTKRYTDLFGVTVDSPAEPIKYQARSWEHPAWAEPLPTLTTPKILSKLEYMNLFTDAELVGIYTAAKSYVQIEVWLAKFNAANDIDLNNPITQAGLNSLERIGILATGRATEIINA